MVFGSAGLEKLLFRRVCADALVCLCRLAVDCGYTKLAGW